MTIPLLYNRIIRLMKNSFCPEKQHELQETGLNKAFKEFVINKKLIYDDILQIQGIAENNIENINNIFLTNYITNKGNKIIITVGSLTNALYQKTHMFTWFEGYCCQLKVYYKTSGSITLPICKDDKRFYSSGYIERMSGSNVSECPPLISYRTSRITFLLYLSSLDLPSALIHKIMTLL